MPTVLITGSIGIGASRSIPKYKIFHRFSWSGRCPRPFVDLKA
jgi:hypothetical protein